MNRYQNHDSTILAAVVANLPADTLKMDDVNRAIRRRLYNCTNTEKNILYRLAADLGLYIDRERIDAQRRRIWAITKARNAEKRARERGLTEHFTASQFLQLLDYYGPQCAYCGSEKNLTVEHIHPLGMGGSNKITNIALTCRACNHARNQLQLGHDPRLSWPLWFAKFFNGGRE